MVLTCSPTVRDAPAATPGERAALHHGHDAFRDMVDAAPEWTFYVRGDGSYAYMSPASAAVSGYAPQDIFDDAALMHRIVHGDDLQAYEHHRHHREPGIRQIRFRIVTRSGEVRHIDHICRTIVDPDGTLRGASVVNRDVTRLVALERSVARTAETLSAGPTVAIQWLVAPGWPITYVSSNVARRGYDPAELVRGETPYTDLVHPDDVERTAAQVTANLDAGMDEYQLCYRLRFADGSYHWVDDATSVVRTSSGRAIRLRGLVTDIDEQVRSRLALEESESRFRRLADNAPDIIYRYEILPERRLAFVNSATTAMTGYTPEELSADPNAFLELVHPDDRGRSAVAASGDAEPGGPIVLRRIHKDGSVLYVEQRDVAVYDEEGSRVAIEGIAREVTARELASAELRRWATVFGRTNVGVVTNVPGHDTFDLVNPAFAAMHGRRPEELRGTPIADLFVESERPALAEAIRLVHENGGHMWRSQHRHADGSTFPVLIAAVEVREDDAPPYRVVTVQDITAWEAARAAQRVSAERERRFAFVLEQSPSIVVLTDTSGDIEYVNRRFEDVTGWRRQDVVGRNTRSLKSGLNDTSTYADLWRTISQGEVWRGELHNARASGEPYWEQATIAPVRNEAGITTHFVKLAEDVTTMKALSLQVDRLAFYDAVKELPNRALFSDRLAHATANARRTGEGLAVLLVRLLGLGGINETRGHAAGDRVLRAAADRMRRALREGDTVARFSGSQFAVLLPSLGASSDAATVARKVRDLIRTPFVMEGRPAFLDVNVGIAVAPHDGTEEAVLTRNAAAALKEAGGSGPGEARFFTAELERATRERTQLETDLRAALGRHEFWLAFQPRFDLVTGVLTGFEALARWSHPTAGAIPPARFIPLAESTGLIHDLGAEVLRMALQQVCSWRDAGRAVVPVAVNLSMHEFERVDVVQRIAAAIRDANVPAEWLEVELTESVAMTDVGLAIDKIAALRRLGVRVAIDDFGTGHASFSYLKRLQVATLKIDRSFIQDLGEGAREGCRDGAIVQAIVSLGSTLGLQVVAEGVETELQRAFLLRHGCPFGQGYLLGRPVPAWEAEAWFDARAQPAA